MRSTALPWCPAGAGARPFCPRPSAALGALLGRRLLHRLLLGLRLHLHRCLSHLFSLSLFSFESVRTRASCAVILDLLTANKELRPKQASFECSVLLQIHNFWLFAALRAAKDRNCRTSKARRMQFPSAAGSIRASAILVERHSLVSLELGRGSFKSCRRPTPPRRPWSASRGA